MEKEPARENRGRADGRSLLIPRFQGTEWGCTRRAGRFPSILKLRPLVFLVYCRGTQRAPSTGP